jgi:hypothetical protein
MRSALSIVLPILFALLITASAAGQEAADAAPDATPTVLSLGTVTPLGSSTCLSGATKGALCTSVRVSCAGIPDLDATLAEASPQGTIKGTIVLVSGGGGTALFNSGFANKYLADGFRVAQLAWVSDWEDTGGVGLKSSACRPSTLFQYLFTTLHASSRTAGFCGQGSSGGGAALAFSLADYGLSSYFDYVVIAAGPGVARMDYGCDKALYTGPSLNLCSQLTNAPYAFFAGGKVNVWENTTTCDGKNPPQADIDKWAADSIVSTGANYSYPKTSMSWFSCVTPPVNNSTGQGKFLIDKVVPKNFPPDINCYSGICQGEAVWQDPTAFSTTQSEMLAKCVPNHK